MNIPKTVKPLKESFDASGSLFGLLKDASGNEPEPTRHLENAVRQLFKKTEPMIGDLEEVQTQSNEMSSVIEKIKKSSPEMADSMKMLNSIDIHEFNKLINNLNKIVNSVAE
jgi:methyl-accepting chemotaxis protein